MSLMSSIFGKGQSSKESQCEEEIKKLTQMLDNLSNIVMLCDTTYENRILYMNRAAREIIMQKYRNQLNDGLKGKADVANAMNNSIHQFHKDPDRIRRILGNPRTLPNSADIPLGGVTFRTRTYPIWDSNQRDKVLCYMACWDDITAEKEIENQRAKEVEAKNYLEHRVQQIATAMEEMTATVRDVAKNTTEASHSAGQITNNAINGQSIVNDAVIGMQKIAGIVRESSDVVQRLGSKSEKIGEIVSVIDNIADQTNLLALNAAIEAARAGEQGRGFAVVADEVRKLAESTGKATKEIGVMIKEIQAETKLAVSTMEQGRSEVETGEVQSNKAGTALERIVKDIEYIKDVIAQIATASEQQAATAQEITRNLEEIA